MYEVYGADFRNKNTFGEIHICATFNLSIVCRIIFVEITQKVIYLLLCSQLVDYTVNILVRK